MPTSRPRPPPPASEATAGPPGSPTQRVGARAEALASLHLERAGLAVIARNYRCRMGELDLVARHGGVLVVVEVRQRADDRYGGAAASITWRKRARIVRATRHLLAHEPALRQLPVRFDAVLVDGEGRVEWIRHAFEAR